MSVTGYIEAEKAADLLLATQSEAVALWEARKAKGVYMIADTGPCGGIVFYISNGGLNGLEAAPSDQRAVPWGCIGTGVTTGTAIGTYRHSEHGGYPGRMRHCRYCR